MLNLQYCSIVDTIFRASSQAVTSDIPLGNRALRMTIMSRTALPFLAEDVSALAKSLRKQLIGHEGSPSHVELLNMLARASGHRNYQHLKAQAAAGQRLAAAPSSPERVDHLLVEQATRHFDGDGRLIRWPAKASHQRLCLWPLWATIPQGEVFSEVQINALLKGRHLFGDHAILRRSLCDGGLVARTPDCRAYRRIERRPAAEALALIRRVGRTA